ncbi:hypothetical protein BJ508DRAFT_300888 [Ascobolus immersus RN42]|uniref:WAC domain-containing protein n=1 Tax=Ascobolus immersus RN42 TaxID=1160509 RepID=A0A3N4J147_ASCIM|nr:hypothetical protein BJ508DRAFT_300888 [Ascobolus immersus RN42]
MVLFKRKPVQRIHTEIQDEDREVWMIPETQEIFTDYQSYLARLEFYKQKRFICEITGHSNMTYFEALKSETAHSNTVDETFPEPLKEPILRKVQFQTISRVDNLVDHIYELFKADFYPGEQVTVTLENGERCEAIVREKTRFPEMRNPFNNVIERSAFARYVVRVIDASDPENDIQVEENALQRDRKIFTKAMLRAFIKNTVAREAWNGAPWLVKDSYAHRYKIDTNVPDSLLRQSTSAARKLASQQRKETEQAMLPAKAKPEVTKKAATPKAPKGKGAAGANKTLNAPGGTLISLDVADNETEWATAGTPTKLNAKPIKLEEKVVKPPPPPPIKYPIDDLHVPYKEPTHVRPKLHFLEPSNVNGGIVINANGFADRTVSYMLETWVFLNVFCDTFHLDSFTFDDYADALQFSSVDTECELYNEVHCSLLKALVNEENGAVEIPLPELPYYDEGSDVEGADQPKTEEGAEAQPARPTYLDHDRMLTNGVRHRGGELPVEEGSDWISLLQRREFQEGGWQWIVSGLLYRLSLDGFYSLMATSLLEHLLPPGKPATKETVREQFLVMDVNLRALLLHLLVGLVTSTPKVRRYMEECSEDMTGLRKKKIEHQRNRKALLEDMRQLEDERKILLPENQPKSASPTPAATPALDEEGDTKMGTEDDSGEEDEKVRNLRKRKREEKSTPVPAAPKQTKNQIAFQKVLKKIAACKAKIDEQEAEIRTIDNDLREADCSRLRMLGTDRFYNRYWWFERNGMPYGGLPQSSTAEAKYANGVLWVQGLTEDDYHGFIEGYEPSEQYKTNLDVNMVERKLKDENGTSLENAHQWAYYDDPTELAALLEWLEQRGVRENKLKKELENLKEKIVEGMQNRKMYLQAFIDRLAAAGSGSEAILSTRSQSKATSSADPANVPNFRCLQWENGDALREIGHKHMDQPKPKTKGKKAAQGWGQKANRK